MSNPYILPDFKRYKMRDLRVYSSTEWLADNKKKYRQVFDRFETSYLYAELSFYNKMFDIDDWEVAVELKCFAVKKAKKELCNLTFKRKVSKYDHVFYVREGWGTGTGTQATTRIGTAISLRFASTPSTALGLFMK